MSNQSFTRFFTRVTLCHVVTYFIFGLFAYLVFDYATLFQSENLACYMRPTTSKWVARTPRSRSSRRLGSSRRKVNLESSRRADTVNTPDPLLPRRRDWRSESCCRSRHTRRW